MKLLVVEDDSASRLLLLHMLSKTSHEVLAAEDGEQAWQLFKEASPQVVISDWHMPKVDGLELARRIRSVRARTYTWFILLTALDFEENYVAASKAGVDDYLVKPLNRDLLSVRLDVAGRVVDMSSQIALLEQCIPICMICKDVRQTKDGWQQLDRYLMESSGVRFSHGYCPHCYFAQSVRPDLKAWRQWPQRDLKDPQASLKAWDAETSAGLYNELVNYVRYLVERLANQLQPRKSVKLSEKERELVADLIDVAPELGQMEVARLGKKLEQLSGEEAARLLLERAASLPKATAPEGK